MTVTHASGRDLSPGHAPARTATFEGLANLPWPGVLALVSLGAAGIHFAVAPHHLQEYWLYGWFMVASAFLQAAWAVAIISRPTRRLYLAGIAGNAALAALWLYTRLATVPIGPDAGSAEPFGRPDELCVIFELVTVVLALALVGRYRAREHRAADWAMLWAVSIVIAAVTGWALSSRIM